MQSSVDTKHHPKLPDREVDITLPDATFPEILLPEATTTVIIPDSLLHKPSTKRHYDAIIDFTGGVAGGVASVYIGQPLDTVKVKLQTFPGLYKNAWGCFTNTLQNEGIWRGLYAGTVPSLAAQVSENAVLFMAYGMCQKLVMAVRNKTSVKDLHPVENAVSGGLAAFWASIVLTPTELIKCKLQAMEQIKKSGRSFEGTLKGVDPNIRFGPWSLTMHILKTEGILGMFRGFIPTIFREMPGYFFFFGGYEVAKSLLVRKGIPRDEIGVVGTIFSGAVGGVSLWLAVFPADVVKSRAQVNTGQKIKFFPTLLTIYKQEGFFALYRGLGPCVLRTIPATGGLFLAYETTKAGLSKLAYGDEWSNR